MLVADMREEGGAAVAEELGDAAAFARVDVSDDGFVFEFPES